MVDDDVVAGARRGQGERAADPPGRAGDQRPAAVSAWLGAASVEAAELEAVQRADRDDEGHDETDGGPAHGVSFEGARWRSRVRAPASSAP